MDSASSVELLALVPSHPARRYPSAPQCCFSVLSRITNHDSPITNLGSFLPILYSKMNMNRNRRNPLKTNDPCTLYSKTKRVLHGATAGTLVLSLTTHQPAAPKLAAASEGGSRITLVNRDKVPATTAVSSTKQTTRVVSIETRFLTPLPTTHQSHVTSRREKSDTGWKQGATCT